MNHQKVYDAIIQKAKSENRIKLQKNQEGYVYYENHHILPKCLGGSNDEENLVLLIAKEHFVCHKLLTYIYKENISLIYAFFMLSHFEKYKIYISSRDYENIRNLIAITPITDEKRINLKLGVKKRKPISENTRKKMSDLKKGKIPWNKGKKHSEESKKKMSESQLKRESFSQKTREKMSESHKGKPIGKGRQLSKKHKENISKYRKGKIANNKGKIAIYKDNKKYFINENRLEEYIQKGYITKQR